MAHRAHIIATAANVVLDRKIRGDEAKCAAAAELVGGSPADRASAEFWCGALIGVAEEMDRAGLDGRHAVRQIRDNNLALASL